MRSLVLLLLVVIAGCATDYQSSSFSGGFKELHISGDVYRITFDGNGYTSRETAQTYWLYRITELALEKGFDGFEIISPINLGLAKENKGFQKASYIFIPMYMDNVYKPILEADIRFIKGAVNPNPPKVFDARALEATLRPYVKGEKKCSKGNVCPHIKDYLKPAKEDVMPTNPSKAI